ncbi:MAG: RnfABCDGE type electron transport complex subunit G [Oscillospiraceae bacterium]|nr:RnfABCDGE type electron transport complex subunit G [Oscillospiraceae bacterium]
MNNKTVKLAFVLFLICAIVAGILGVVNELAKTRIAQYQDEKELKALSIVLPADSFSPVKLSPKNFMGKKISVISVMQADNGSGYAVKCSFSGAQGIITMLVGVNNDLKCTGISILSHSETSGLGANAASTAEVGVNFRSQFEGVGADVALAKKGGTIDALTGATITSSSVTNAVSEAIRVVESIG